MWVQSLVFNGVLLHRVANIVFQKSLEVLNVQVAIGLPRHRSQLGGVALHVFVRGHKFFLQNRVKILDSRVLAGGFLMGCGKKFLVSSIYI